MSQLRLLGGAVVEDESGRGGALASRRHPLALLALLATAPSCTLSRGKLVGLLWPESSEKTARNRLTSCVYEVRSALGDEVLVSVGRDLRLNRDGVDCDVCSFDKALEERDYQEAVSLYDGPFLDGFYLGGSPEFERWVDRERDRLARAYHAALEALAAEAEERDEPEAAVGWWRELTSEDPYDSRVAVRLMKALAAAGNRAEALRVARTHARLLDEEFGTAPDAELHALVERLQAPPSESADGNEVVDTDRGEAGARVAGELPALSIAVLPFANLSGTADAEPFAAGLHDDLLTELSRISALRVIARTSVLRYRDTDRPIREIARELGVGTIVEGGVQSAGGRLRLNVQLIDARSGAHRWVERYDRELSTSSIFDIQSELATKIASALRAELTPAEMERVGQESTEDLDAYRLYVQGRGHLHERTKDALQRAVEYLSRAIERDAGYAVAWAGLADALSISQWYDFVTPETAPDAMKAALRAVELAPDLGEAHASLGIAHALRQDGPAAVQELSRAVELQPSHAEAHAWLGWVYLVVGRPREALQSELRAVELNPLAPAYRVFLAEAHLANGDAAEALRQARRGRGIQPEYGLAHFIEGLILHHMGRYEDASVALRTSLDLVLPPWGSPTHAEVRAVLAATHVASGDRGGARKLLAEIDHSADPLAAGLAYAALGDRDRAFEAFASVEHWRSITTEHIRYFFPDVLGPLRQDARYRDLLREVDRSWGLEPEGRAPTAES